MVSEFPRLKVSHPGSCATGSYTELFPRQGLVTISVLLPPPPRLHGSPKFPQHWFLRGQQGPGRLKTEGAWGGGSGRECLSREAHGWKVRPREDLGGVGVAGWGQHGRGTQAPQVAARRDSMKQEQMLSQVLMTVCVGAAAGAGKTWTLGLGLTPEPPGWSPAILSVFPIPLKNGVTSDHVTLLVQHSNGPTLR